MQDMNSTGFTEKSNAFAKANSGFVKDIMNGMYDWVRVLDRDDNVIYMNSSMSRVFDSAVPDKKCFEVLGRKMPCENCTSRKSVFDGQTHEKEEEINGRIYSVMSSPVKDEKEEIIAVVEVLRDITQTKYLQHRLFEQNLKLQNDLSIARKLQCSLLPRELPDDKINFSFIYKPCEALGGDFLDIFKIDEDHTGIYVADVSGHGVAASMLTVFLRSALNKKLLSPALALEELYTQYNESNFDQDLYITLFYMIIDVKAKTAVYSNAGHNVCPILFNPQKFEILRVPGIPISNWTDHPGYTDRLTALSSGDKLFFYTDGIIEMRNNIGEQYGEERLLGILLNESSDPSAILNSIIDKACEFAGISDSTNIPDDITMALLEIK
jgi:sigma-B regulation protein RsbU (phosphoserine phosphatase)